MKIKLKKKQKKQLEVAILLALAIFVILLWDTYLIYPIKMLVIILHEISHGIVAVLSGHTVKSIEITRELGGRTIITGGNSFAVAFAGYIGSTILGALFFFSAYNIRLLRIFSLSLGVVILLFTVNVFSGTYALLFGLIFAIVLFLLPFLKYERVVGYIYKFIGLTSVLYILTDIKEDLFVSGLRQTDAQLLAELTGTSPLLWAFVYLGISLFVLLCLFRYAFKKGMA